MTKWENELINLLSLSASNMCAFPAYLLRPEGYPVYTTIQLNQGNVKLIFSNNVVYKSLTKEDIVETETVGNNVV